MIKSNLQIAAILFAAVIGHAPLLFAQAAIGIWQPTEPANWNVDENWLVDFSPFVPSADFDEAAEISNGGTAIVNETVPDVVSLTVSQGTVDVQNGGSLSMVRPFDVGGHMTIGANGIVRLSGNGTLATDFNATNNGLLSLTGPNATLQVGGDFSNNGTLESIITGDAHSVIEVTGTASLSGTLAPSFTGVTPSFGDSWDLINAGSISSNFNQIDLSNAPSLPLGLTFSSVVNGSTAQLQVGNQLVMTVDRTTGQAEIANLVGDPIEITGYTIESANGFISMAGFTGLADGWENITAGSELHVGQLNLNGSTLVSAGDAPLNLGAPYAPGSQTADQEDLVFRYSTIDGGVIDGAVVFEGSPNDLVLNVNPETGEAAISNLSPFIAPELTGYTVTSAGGALDPSFAGLSGDPSQAGPGWEKAASNDAAVAELNLENSTVFGTNTVALLGNLFAPGGPQDLVFEYATIEGDILPGVVQYGEIPVIEGGLPADFNKDGMVDLTDFNILKANFGQSDATMADGDANMDSIVDLSDFNILKASFGQSAAAVPEPSSLVLMLLAGSILAVRRIRS